MKLRKQDRVRLWCATLADADHVFGTVALISENQRAFAVSLDSQIGFRTPDGGLLITEALPLSREYVGAPVTDIWGGVWTLEVIR
jgi:hypothetical protein